MKLFVIFAALLAGVLVNEINGENKVSSQCLLNDLSLKKTSGSVKTHLHFWSQLVLFFSWIVKA